jgi:hypothetical protein
LQNHIKSIKRRVCYAQLKFALFVFHTGTLLESRNQNYRTNNEQNDKRVVSANEVFSQNIIWQNNPVVFLKANPDY